MSAKAERRRQDRALVLSESGEWGKLLVGGLSLKDRDVVEAKLTYLGYHTEREGPNLLVGTARSGAMSASEEDLVRSVVKRRGNPSSKDNPVYYDLPKGGGQGPGLFARMGLRRRIRSTEKKIGRQRAKCTIAQAEEAKLQSQMGDFKKELSQRNPSMGGGHYEVTVEPPQQGQGSKWAVRVFHLGKSGKRSFAESTQWSTRERADEHAAMWLRRNPVDLSVAESISGRNPSAGRTWYSIGYEAGVRAGRAGQSLPPEGKLVQYAGVVARNLGEPTPHGLNMVDYISGFRSGWRLGVEDPIENPEEHRLMDTIGPGDRVTIIDRFGKEHSGRAVMRSSHGGWVLNMGGPHGTPGIADESNTIRVRKAKRKNPGAANYVNVSVGYLSRSKALSHKAERESQGMTQLRIVHSGKYWFVTAPRDQSLAVDASGRLLYRFPNRSNPEAASAELYESFHDRPSESSTEYVEELHVHENLAELGDLTELKVASITKLDITLSFESCGIKLASSEDGKQLFFVGGDQSIPLDRFKMDSPKWQRDSMVLGVLYELTYRTEKGFDKFELTDYFHGLGEETGVQPVLLYDLANQQLSVSGGHYQVKPEGIVN